MVIIKNLDKEKEQTNLMILGTGEVILFSVKYTFRLYV
jgi:hypothetical protein